MSSAPHACLDAPLHLRDAFAQPDEDRFANKVVADVELDDLAGRGDRADIVASSARALHGIRCPSCPGPRCRSNEPLQFGVRGPATSA